MRSTRLPHYVDSDDFEDSIDGITLVQEYIRAPEPFITRVEFVGGKFLYAVRVDTTLGFELCPADVVPGRRCVLPGRRVDASTPAPAAPRFRIVRDFRDPIVERYQRFIADNGIGISGIEFITDAAASCTPTTSIRTPITTAPRKLKPAFTGCAQSPAISAMS